MQKEPLDATWAQRMEKVLRESAVAHPGEVRALECRATVCAIEVSSGQPSYNGLTDAHATTEGLRVSRVKGSRDNTVRWTSRLHAVWNAALALRWEILARPNNRRRPIPMRPEDRYVFLSRDGDRLSKSAQPGVAGIHRRRGNCPPRTASRCTA